MNDNQIRRRAKANFPTVLLTLLSIVQALALELMWSELSAEPTLYVWSLAAVVGWLQIAATLLGILLVWLIYSDLVLRFSWLPNTLDAVFPFLVGLGEFALITSLGPSQVVTWLCLFSVLFLAMNWVSQSTMKRARQDVDNKDFFDRVAPATLRDNLLRSAPAGVILLLGILLWISGSNDWLALLAMMVVTAMLCYQMWMNHIYTRRAFRLDNESEPSESS